MVDSAEVGDDDRNGQGDDQHTAQRADGAKDLPHDGLWYHVTISETRQRTDFRFTLSNYMQQTADTCNSVQYVYIVPTHNKIHFKALYIVRLGPYRITVHGKQSGASQKIRI